MKNSSEFKMETKQNEALEMESRPVAHKTTANKWRIAATVGVIMLAFVASATVIGVYVGKNAAEQDMHKESWVVYHDTSTNKIIKERFIVQGMEVAVTIPGELTIILDFGENQAVLQVDGVKTKQTGDCLCMVFNLNGLTTVSYENVYALLNETYIDVSQNFNVDRLTLEHSYEDVDPHNLSRKSVEMCLGCKIWKMKVYRNSGFDRQQSRDKRNYSTTGSFTFMLPDGRIKVVTYIADENGYRQIVEFVEPVP